MNVIRTDPRAIPGNLSEQLQRAVPPNPLERRFVSFLVPLDLQFDPAEGLDSGANRGDQIATFCWANCLGPSHILESVSVVVSASHSCHLSHATSAATVARTVVEHGTRFNERWRKVLIGAVATSIGAASATASAGSASETTICTAGRA